MMIFGRMFVSVCMFCIMVQLVNCCSMCDVRSLLHDLCNSGNERHFNLTSGLEINGICFRLDEVIGQGMDEYHKYACVYVEVSDEIILDLSVRNRLRDAKRASCQVASFTPDSFIRLFIHSFFLLRMHNILRHYVGFSGRLAG